MLLDFSGMKQDLLAPFNMDAFVSGNHVTCFCSAPGIGKTTFLMDLSYRMHHKQQVAYVSFSSTRKQLEHLKAIKDRLCKDNKRAEHWQIIRLRYVRFTIDLIGQMVQILNAKLKPEILIIDDLSSFRLLVEEEDDYSSVDLLETIINMAKTTECRIVFTVPIRFSKVKTATIEFRHWLNMDGGIGSADLSDAVVFLDRPDYYESTPNRWQLLGQIAQAKDASLLHHAFESNILQLDCG